MDLLSDPIHLLAVFGAALLAGAGNAVAGGGTTLSFPILVWVGLPPVLANTTNAVGLWPSSVGGAWSYRRRIRTQEGWARLWIPALVGGGLGAGLLLALPPHWFGAIAPWLVIAAATLITLDPLLRRQLSAAGPRPRRLGSSAAALFLISIYGGYFGAGMGILILLTLGLLGIADLHDANGLKNILVIGIQGIAVLWFALSGMVHWPIALVMVVGSSLGGLVAGHAIQKVDQRSLRWVVGVMGMTLGLIMLLRR